MKIKICDRCGKRIEKTPLIRPSMTKEYDVVLECYLEKYGRSGKTYDLCYECYQELKDFIEKGKEVRG